MLGVIRGWNFMKAPQEGSERIDLLQYMSWNNVKIGVLFYYSPGRHYISSIELPDLPDFYIIKLIFIYTGAFVSNFQRNTCVISPLTSKLNASLTAKMNDSPHEPMSPAAHIFPTRLLYNSEAGGQLLCWYRGGCESCWPPPTAAWLTKVQRHKQRQKPLSLSLYIYICIHPGAQTAHKTSLSLTRRELRSAVAL